MKQLTELGMQTILLGVYSFEYGVVYIVSVSEDRGPFNIEDDFNIVMSMMGNLDAHI